MVNPFAVSDIIFAPATPPGPSGIAVYRLSGSGVCDACQALGLPPHLPPRQATLRALHHPDTNALIDHALVIYFQAPHSFTGEDVIELHTHGGSAVRNAILNALSALPLCRFAEPGEFSKRAFINGKMDLLQAEGIADLIAAQTPEQQKLALMQLGGELSSRFEALRDMAIRPLALLEAYIDFPDEDIPESVLSDIEHSTAELHHAVKSLLEEPPCGAMIRDGMSVAIIGPPNAGKSTLMNRLAAREVAIVSDIPGTTRDRIEVQLNLNGYLVRLIDTAGLREAQDMVEREGVKKALETANNADIRIVLLDIVSDVEQFDIEALLGGMIDYERTLLVMNKCDESPSPVSLPDSFNAPLLISAKTGQGVDALINQLGEHIEAQMAKAPTPSLTRARHRASLTEADGLLATLHLRGPQELAAEELRCVARAIGKITGKIEVDQLLDVVFREFCIGK